MYGRAEPPPQDASRAAVWKALAGQRHRAVRVALARGADAQDVDDVVHEAMLRVAAMPRVDLARVGPLLTTVVTNLVVDGHRRRAAADKALRRLRAQPAEVPPVDDDICDAAEARWLDEQIPSLPAQDGRVLRLRALGVTRRQAAASLGITDKAAEGAYSRARSRMNAIWRPTAALLGIGWVRQLRHWRTAAPAAGAAAAAFVVVALHHTPEPAPPDSAVPPPAPSAADLPKRPLVRADAPARLTALAPPQDPAPADAPLGPARRTQPKRISKPIMSTRPLDGTAGLTGGSVGVEQRDPDQSLTESLQQCIEEGVTVTPYEIGC